jgi:hypothetical protein
VVVLPHPMPVHWCFRHKSRARGKSALHKVPVPNLRGIKDLDLKARRLAHPSIQRE